MELVGINRGIFCSNILPGRTVDEIYFQSVQLFHHVWLDSLIWCPNFWQVQKTEAHSTSPVKRLYTGSRLTSISTLFLQMLGEQFTPLHTSQRKWCSCSRGKVSLPSWPPSSRSPPRQESFSPSTSRNTGNPSVILFILAFSSFSAQLYCHGLPSALISN